MIVMAEKALSNTIAAAITTFRGNLAYFVPQIYAQETAANQQQITTWWSNGSNTCTITPGYLTQPITAPRITVTTENEDPIAQKRFIGQVMSSPIDSGTITAAAAYHGIYTIHCMSVNQNMLLWLQALAKWAVLSTTLALEQQYGLMNQLVTLGPMQPMPNSMQDSVFPFERNLTFACDYMDTWTSIPVEVVQSVSVGFTDIVV